jgi:hypothetical protein
MRTNLLYSIREELARSANPYPSSLPSEGPIRYAHLHEDPAEIMDSRLPRPTQARSNRQPLQQRDHHSGFTPYPLGERRNTIRPSPSPYIFTDSPQRVERPSR